MKTIPAILVLVLFSFTLIFMDYHRRRPPAPGPDGCVSCHDRVSDPGPSHPVRVLGCAVCHMGNPYSLDRRRAHVGMVKNPGDLRVVDATCGTKGCHRDAAGRVRKSLMATNRGILSTLQRQWLRLENPGTGVRRLMQQDPPENLALDHYRKMCGGCHLWKRRGDRRGEVGRRGGGCTDCHVPDTGPAGPAGQGPLRHPQITTRIPPENCTKCHNRSARIGLSYFGRFESAGYGTPFERGSPGARRLSGGRFFIRLQADVHFKKAGMTCIDCHTAAGLMGDGSEHEYMKDQVDITCEACHRPSFSVVTDPESPAKRLAFLNRKVPAVKGDRVAVSGKGTLLYNLRKQGTRTVLFRKMDGAPVVMTPSGGSDPYHGMPGHERLSCQACHSAWMPQCYGCHLTYDRSGRQKDWLDGRLSRGRWREARSYIRFSRPALGLGKDGRIFPVSPCQVFAAVFDENGRYRKRESFTSFSLSAFDPHTTARASRDCLECHLDPKTLGMGEGILRKKDGKWVLRSSYDAAASSMGTDFPLDAFISPRGRRLKEFRGTGARPFGGREISRILSVAPCLGCHDRYDDRIYRDFRRSENRFETEPDLPCLK
ncbi:MAG: hypothetical protein DRH56_00870 [Deltaproteobacteria bacterium]|nr:MAG: hypothetical protein DRH56_00870 [Deltaproteobacteria bacterium]